MGYIVNRGENFKKEKEVNMPLNCAFDGLNFILATDDQKLSMDNQESFIAKMSFKPLDT